MWKEAEWTGTGSSFLQPRWWKMLRNLMKKKDVILPSKDPPTLKSLYLENLPLFVNIWGKKCMQAVEVKNFGLFNKIFTPSYTYCSFCIFLFCYYFINNLSNHLIRHDCGEDDRTHLCKYTHHHYNNTGKKNTWGLNPIRDFCSTLLGLFVSTFVEVIASNYFA